MFSKHIWCVHQRLSHCPPSARRPVAVQSLNTTPSSTSAFCCRTLARSSTRTIPQHRAPISDILAAAELLTTLKSHMSNYTNKKSRDQPVASLGSSCYINRLGSLVDISVGMTLKYHHIAKKLSNDYCTQLID
ncbi:uncharacterized protein LOC122279325 isoform X2 [Carya illinoinensis]|uniref:uncharacterized protein LOC122279325 isoform X2 n=1 Tax=Carya illinoinensis TaxID=32201 RepID=UPI001C720537|nr:uncharacterized protein LOC122279325 isoform X2 [Carya illinoinensis]